MEITTLYETIRPRYPELRGKVALVTGSSMGIGKGIALRLAREGMHIVVHGKEEEVVAQTVREFEALGVDALGIHTDFAAPDGVDRLFEAFRRRYDTLALLVNNAASMGRKTVQEATADLFDSQLAINVRAPYLCVLRALPLMGAGGGIINISSVGGQRAHWRGLPYDLTKGAIDSMTQAMAINLAAEGIRVNAIAPGAIRTDKTLPPDHETVIALNGRIPLGRLGSALEIGAMVAFLASEDASYITGQVINVDGGVTAQLSPPGQPI